MNEHAGNRWYKCDLHLHSMSSECYQNKADTPQQWIARALEEELSVIAVTDHNDYRGIDAISREAKEHGISVFPGVEITCDTSKIHLLILFDINKSSETVRDFLNRCDIYSELIGSPEGTSLSVFEICEIAKKRGAIVIASHIDEFNSISSMNPANLDKILRSGLIDAVQVTNTAIWRQYKSDHNAEAMIAAIRSKYGFEVSTDEIDRWRKCFDRAEEAGIPMLAFSDNPCAPDSSRHGLWGIGSNYTWIQMDNDVDFDSLKQSFITPDSRIRMKIDCPDKPNIEPDFWIRSLEARNTTLNPHVPIHLDFHPQLNCIIGGRGSGKSAIVRILSGVYNQLTEVMLHTSVLTQNEFYQRKQDDGYGIFTDKSEVEIRYSMHGRLYRLLVSDIIDMNRQKITLYRVNPESGNEEETPLNNAFYSLMNATVFVQSEINEIADTPGSLMEQIDWAITSMYALKHTSRYYYEQIINLSMELHSAKKLFANEQLINDSLEWVEQITKDGGFSKDQILTADEPIENLQDAASLIDYCREQIDVLTAKRTDTIKHYKKSIEQIRNTRTAFLNRVYAEDENYKAKLKPFASRPSFHSMVARIMKCDLQLIHDDVRTLENALFDEKNGMEKYRRLLLSIRKDAALPLTDFERGALLLSEEKGIDFILQEGLDHKFSDYFDHRINELPYEEFLQMLFFHPEDELQLFYHPKGVKRLFPLTTASTGEKVSAIISMILASDTKPLVIDQPEDSIDNRIVYEEMIGKIKRAKQTHQLILTTHNANIVTNADADMIITMDSWSKFVKVRCKGTIDNPEIRSAICDTLEGSENAFLQRARKYHLN